MAFDPNCYDACAAGCFSVSLLLPPPLDIIAITTCGLGCFAACQSENVAFNGGLQQPEFPWVVPPDQEVIG
jgi:hypothetical protein